MARSVRKFTETKAMRSGLFDHIRSHRYLFLISIFTLFVVLACLYVWQRVIVIELSKDVSALQIENRELVDDLKKLQTDIAALSMTSRIEKYANDSLDLNPISAEKLFTLVRETEQEIPSDELSRMFSSIKRVVEYLPVSAEANANDQDISPIKFDEDGN